MGTDDAAFISEGTAPSTILVRPKMEEAVVCLNSQDIGEKARKPAAARKAARASAPNAKVRITGEDKAVKAKTVKVAKAKVVKVAKAVKETKVKVVKETKAKVTKGLSAKVVKEPLVMALKETPAKPVKVPKEKPAKEAKAEVVKQNRVENEPIEPKIAQVKQPKVRKATGVTRRPSECFESSFVLSSVTPDAFIETRG